MKLVSSTRGRAALSTTLAFALVACGGGGGSTAVAPPTGGGGSPTPTPPTNTTCSIANQIDFANDVLNEWYLFPNLLDNTVDASGFSDVQSYLDARVAPARAQSRDKGFTFATSIAEENALINSGASAGFGIRLAYDTTNNRVFLFEAFENAPGFQAGMDRGTELLAIGTSAANLESVNDLMASGGPQAVVNALGPSDPGVARVIRFAQVDGTVVEANISKTSFSLDPVSDRYGALIIDDNGKKVGYLNLRTFIVATADRELADAFQLFSDEGVTELVIDFRYNGGGLVRVAELMGDLLRGSNTGEVFSRTTLRESKSDRNEERLFSNTTQFFNPNTNDFDAPTSIPSVNPVKIAFITTQNSASASELVANAMIPYVDPANIAIIGSDTSGKPVGQFGFDFADCDLRIRAVTFQTVNADDQGEYFTGLASVMPNSCRAFDDIGFQLGDRQEDSLSVALDFLNGVSCTAISGSGLRTAQSVGGREALRPERPNAAQWEIPGLF